MLTPLGERMYPLLKQCYDSAQSARALAAMINDGEVGALKIAVSSSIELGLILYEVNELRSSFSEIELKILRGTRSAARRIPQGRRRRARGRGIDRRGLGPARQLEAVRRAVRHGVQPWPPARQPGDHRARGPQARALPAAQPLRKGGRSRRRCCAPRGSNADQRHEVASDQDLLALLEANIGIGFLPRTVNARKPGARRGARLRSRPHGLPLRRRRAGSARRSPRPS